MFVDAKPKDGRACDLTKSIDRLTAAREIAYGSAVTSSRAATILAPNAKGILS